MPTTSEPRPRLFQYATSTDPEVIAVIERNHERRSEWQAKAYDWAVAHGASGFYPIGIAGRLEVSAIDLPEHPTGFGRWKPMRRGWAPYKNNPLFKEMAALRYDAEPVPGLPATFDSARDEQWRHYIMTPHPFVHDGAAWVGLAHMPVAEEGLRGVATYGEQWTECLPSQWHAAHEAVTNKTLTEEPADA